MEGWQARRLTTSQYASAITTAPRKIKCLVLGGAGAGKTSILRRYFNGIFQPQRIATLGSDFYTGRIQNPLLNSAIMDDRDDVGDEKKMTDATSGPPNSFISMQVWDTPGRERFAANRKAMYTASFSDSFFKNADAAILVYDITSSTSFTQLLKWHADLMERNSTARGCWRANTALPCLDCCQ